MRIQVVCRDGDPHALYLGSRWLQVLEIIERGVEVSTRRFQVRVADGRVFQLNRDLASGDWRLAGVNRHASTP